MIVFVSCVLFIVAVRGKPPLEVVSTKVYSQDLSTYGVDAESCKRMVYQVKGCRDHLMHLLDGKGAELASFYIGLNINSVSYMDIPPNKDLLLDTRDILHCDKFRWFWMSWDAGRIKYGKGRVPGEDAIFDLEDPTGSQVKRFGLTKWSGVETTIKLGETERDRFARVLQEGKFSDGMISETSTSRETCVTLCSDHNNCGMFSYNQGLGLCAIFDRMTSSFNVTSEGGWRSWKLLYCYP